LSGRLVNVIPRTVFDLSQGLGGSGTISVAIGDPVSLRDYTEAGMVVRVHSATISANAQMSVNAFADGYIAYSNFAYAGQFLGAASMNPGVVAPSVIFASVACIGEYAVIVFTANAASAGLTLKAVISVDLMLRNGDPLDLTDRPEQPTARAWPMPSIVTASSPDYGSPTRSTAAPPPTPPKGPCFGRKGLSYIGKGSSSVGKGWLDPGMTGKMGPVGPPAGENAGPPGPKARVPPWNR
jgi:hypothetical protein